MIDAKKKYRTRDGRPVRILATDFKGAKGCVVAAVTSSPGREGIWQYFANGKEVTGISSLDLLEIGLYDHIHENDIVAVKAPGNYPWRLRRFAYEHGGIAYVYVDGTSSTDEIGGTESWSMCRLVCRQEDEITEVCNPESEVSHHG